MTPQPMAPEYLVDLVGKCSYFGGPEDTGVAADEGLALIADVDDAPQVFLPFQPEGTTGLARRLESVHPLRGVLVGLRKDAEGHAPQRCGARTDAGRSWPEGVSGGLGAS